MKKREVWILPSTTILLVLIALSMLFFYGELFELKERIDIKNREECKREGVYLLNDKIYSSIDEANGNLAVKDDNKAFLCFKGDPAGYTNKCTVRTKTSECFSVIIEKDSCYLQESHCENTGTSFFVRMIFPSE